MAREFDDATVFQLGRLTLAFILLDQAITDLTSDLLECRDGRIARGMVVRLNFQAKVDALKWLIERRGEAVPASQGAVRELHGLLHQARELATHRNDLIHGHVYTHKETREVLLVNFGKGRQARLRGVDAEEIAQLNDQMTDVGLALIAQASRVRSELLGVDGEE
jgi:hypothetical protein